MRIKVIACEVVFREVCFCAARAKAIVDLVFLRRGLHSNPDTLRAQVQDEIDRTDEAPGVGQVSNLPHSDESQVQAVALAYGLCSNGVAGLRARGVPLVIPRAHDCITFLLGSKEEYARRFAERPGTYYYSGGWIERGADRVPRSPEDGAGLDASFEELVAKYGQDNAEYLWEYQSNWIKRYTHAAYLSADLGDEEAYRAYTQRIAQEHGWAYEESPADLSLLQALLDGDWDDDRFLVVPPGHQVIPNVGPEVIAAGP